MSSKQPKTVYDALSEAVSAHGGKVAIRFESQALTFNELLAQVDNTSRHLRSHGLSEGDIFAAYGQNRPELMLLYYAAAKIGAVFVPINPNLTPPEVEYTVKHSQAKLLYYDDIVAESAKLAVTDKLLSIDTLSNYAPGDDRRAQTSGSEDFLVIYTSGSTGTPKAIVLDHDAQVNVAISVNSMWGLRPQDKTLVALPLGYLYGLSTAAGAALQRGATVVILRRFHPRDVLEAIVTHQPNVFHGVPTMYSMMLEYCEQRNENFDLSSLTSAITAGAPMPTELKVRFLEKFGVEIQNYYSMTEATPVFGKSAGDRSPIPLGSAGRLFPGTKLKIVRADGSECSPDEPGELLVRCAATMKRYQGDPELTEKSMVDGLFRSGDLVRLDAQGYYYVVGRIKDIIIRGGANISPAEVERSLVSHPSVQDAAVVGTSDRIFGEVPVAFVVRRFGAGVRDAEIITHVEQQLSDFKVPRTIHFLKELPLGKTGKVDKKLLKARAEELKSNG